MDRDELIRYFDAVDEDKRSFAIDTIDEYLFFKNKIEELKKLPLIRYSPKNPERQQLTPAAKLIKEYSQVMDAKRGTLLRMLYRIESTAADELLSRLSEFE